MTRHGSFPVSAGEDIQSLKEIAAELLTSNGVDETFLAKLELDRLPSICGAVNALSCSILGSYLAQEVIKAVSLSGAPGFNVFEFCGERCLVRAFPFGVKN